MQSDVNPSKPTEVDPGTRREPVQPSGVAGGADALSSDPQLTFASREPLPTSVLENSLSCFPFSHHIVGMLRFP